MAGEELSDLTSINILPDELIVLFFKYLSLEDILMCEDVCKRWRKLALDPILWRQFVIVFSGKPGQSEVSEKNLEIISTHSEFIYSLKIQYVYNYSDIESILCKCHNLISLELVMCRISKNFEDDLRNRTHLRKLSLKNSIQLSSEVDWLFPFDHLKELKYLALSDFGLAPGNCNMLLECKNLSHIYIEKIRDLNLDFVKNLILSKANILETLHIYGGDSVDDACLKMLSRCTQLRDLAIIRCENLTDEGLVNLIYFKKLEHLQIWNNNNFSEMVLLKTLGNATLITLESLSLSRVKNISPVIVDIISEYYKNLKFLALYQCPRIINTDYEKQLKSKFRNIDVVLY
ncbi:S-phase kinase-associated protein 2 [Pieris rapae]|uniref:S-phase kinase-associated protein 2 n=1 Tax=Pieris rapae TaxID=64459 RepID=UPI001E2812B4|nr:S-phase kinase-associated protein 2 [Pieris rapae]